MGVDEGSQKSRAAKSARVAERGKGHREEGAIAEVAGIIEMARAAGRNIDE